MNIENLKGLTYIKITPSILEYIKKEMYFEIIPEEDSMWNVKNIISYPNVYNGNYVIELENNFGEWLRLPLSLIFK